MNKNLLVVIIVLIGIAIFGYFTYEVMQKPDIEKALFTSASETTTVTQNVPDTNMVQRKSNTTVVRSTAKTSSAKRTTTVTRPSQTTPTNPPATPVNTPTPTGTKLPDLIIESITVSPAAPKINNVNVEITVTIKNTGQGNLTTSNPVNIYIESDAGFYTEKVLTTSIAPGKTSQIKYKPFAGNDEIYDPGEFAIDAYVNIDAEVEEDNYDNNDKSIMVEFVE